MFIVLLTNIAVILLVSLNNIFVFSFLFFILIKESSVNFLYELKLKLFEVFFMDIIFFV